MKTAKSKNLLFAGLDSKKGLAKSALFWRKGNATPKPDGFCVGFSRFEARLCLVSNPKTNRQEVVFTF
ncbi:MAG: hypothetical protein LBU11_10945 [Zoogloeaceae bacterium]|nr:hypothetical protein [Zoogloeaceae bacterium]